MKKVLIVEDSATVTKVLKHLVKQEPAIDAFFAASFEESRCLYEQHKDEIFAAIVDLNLPDAPDGETVDFFLAEKLPVIVLTANYREEVREGLLNKGIVDYVIKESRYSYSVVFKLIKRLDKNQQIKVLVAEDSRSMRNFIKSLLQRHLYQVLEAENGVQALAVLQENPDIKILVTDYHMPEMDGFELVKTIRQSIDKSGLVIIGLSGEGQGALSAKFIKNGANDFLPKPFYHEEFYCRIMHNIEELELLAQVKEIAYRDHLTNLHNRRYFYEQGEAIYKQAKEKGSPLALAVLSIDYFKPFNENYGHQAGDEVLIFLAQELEHGFSRFVVSRMDGDQFMIFLPGLNNEQAITYLDRFRSLIHSSSIPVTHEDTEVNISISAGVTNQLFDTLEQQINYVEQLLNHAKEAGRNIVVGDD